MTDGDESDQRLSEALRARAGGAGWPVPARATAADVNRASPTSGVGIRTLLLIALLAGAVLGMALALVSLLVPGLLPPLG